MIVLDRCEKLNICVYGIEAWLNGKFYDIKSNEDFAINRCDSKWYQLAMIEFKKEDQNLLYAASYDVPKKLLKS